MVFFRELNKKNHSKSYYKKHIYIKKIFVLSLNIFGININLSKTYLKNEKKIYIVTIST